MNIRARHGCGGRHAFCTVAAMDQSVRNGVDTATLFATIDAVKATPQLAKFRFRAVNHWVSGAHSQSTIHAFHGVMQDLSHERVHVIDADHPTVLVGGDRGVTPVEFVLHALAACLTAGLANIAAARGVTLTEVESTLEGDIDLLGIFGLSDEVRRGFRRIKVSFKVRGDEPAKLEQLVVQARRRSAVFDILTNGVPIDIEVDAA